MSSIQRFFVLFSVSFVISSVSWAQDCQRGGRLEGRSAVALLKILEASYPTVSTKDKVGESLMMGVLVQKAPLSNPKAPLLMTVKNERSDQEGQMPEAAAGALIDLLRGEQNLLTDREVARGFSARIFCLSNSTEDRCAVTVIDEDCRK